jgi:hypothetical protein
MDNYGNNVVYKPNSKNRVGSFSRADRFAEMDRELRHKARIYVGPQSYDSNPGFNAINRVSCPVKMVIFF